MNLTIGIRREDKNEWERRVPLIPEHAADMQHRHGLQITVQSSPIRIFQDEAYRSAGVHVSEDLSPASLILAVKEIPSNLLQANKTYVFFSHVIKGQAYNMPMLKRLMELECSLVDYEKIVDERGRRLIFFGVHAGYAGMIETLWCLGQRLESEGMTTPFAKVRHAHEYRDLEAAKIHLEEVGRDLVHTPLPESLAPIVFGIAGYGNVSRGAQEVLDVLPITKISVADLPAASTRPQAAGGATLLKVVFAEEHMVRPSDAGRNFNLSDYYQNPQHYRGCFESHLPYLDVLVNAIYWEERYPRLVTRKWAEESFRATVKPRLKVIGDISCDILGSIELTLKSTQPDHPCYVYDVEQGRALMGVAGRGPVIMAVDTLPCELPMESSRYFSTQLKEMVPHLAGADWQADFEDLNLPSSLKKAVIVHKGALTPAYEYLRRYVES